MDWRTLLIILVKAGLQAWADEVDPAGRYDDDPKEAPTPRRAEAPPKAKPPASPSEGWGPPSEAPAVSVIRIETDAGVTVAPASFVGDECFGMTKVERTRQPSESRRARRLTKAVSADAPKAPRAPWVTGFLERANAARDAYEKAMRVEEVHSAMIVESSQAAQGPPRRIRSRGDVLPNSSLSPATLMLLSTGAPTTGVPRAV